MTVKSICGCCGHRKNSASFKRVHGRSARLARSWTRAEWKRYRSTGALPAWDLESRADRRRYGQR